MTLILGDTVNKFLHSLTCLIYFHFFLLIYRPQAEYTTQKPPKDPNTSKELSRKDPNTPTDLSPKDTYTATDPETTGQDNATTIGYVQKVL